MAKISNPMLCSFCQISRAHPSTGCQYAEQTLACHACTVEFWGWVRQRINSRPSRRVGGPSFYDHVAPMAYIGRRTLLLDPSIFAILEAENMTDIRQQVTWVNAAWDRYLVISSDNPAQIRALRLAAYLVVADCRADLSSCYVSEVFEQAAIPGNPAYASFSIQLFGLNLDRIVRQISAIYSGKGIHPWTASTTPSLCCSISDPCHIFD
jgi:hypothetical protein